MTNTTINAYKLMFDSPEDIDLWSAGVSEQRMSGALIGPTFACIIAKQFENLRSDLENFLTSIFTTSLLTPPWDSFVKPALTLSLGNKN